MKSRDYRLGYSKGYQTASTRWPEHRPPHPPEPTIRKLMEALRVLRDTADAELACFSEDDELVLKFNGPIEQADEAMIEVTEWLRKESSQDTRGDDAQ